MPQTLPPKLSQYRSYVEAFAARHLIPYLRRFDELPSAAPVRKEFNDPVWGTITLYAPELVVLDSPLLQRLRSIRQLGVAHWVYPGANHTRLEHCLGVVHQIERLVGSINSTFPEDQKIIQAPFRRLLRLAALCHDIGHGLFSHVSENALRFFDECEDLRTDFADYLSIETCHLSEMAAYFIIGSPTFEKLLAVATSSATDYSLPAQPTDLIRKAIVGLPISDDIPLLHELISGPFDADKLDYMTRDAHMAGVPIVTDIPRLAQKVRAVQVSQDDLPTDVACKVSGGKPAYILTGIALSGGRTLDELMLGRALLFDKVYRHQKVRAAEAMVASLTQNLASIVAQHPAHFPLTVTDDELLVADAEAIEALAERDLSDEDRANIAVAHDILSRLRSRRLFVRAFAVAQNMPLDPYRSDQEQRRGLELLLRSLGDPVGRRELVEAIADETGRILALLGADGLISEIPQGRLAAYIHFDPPLPPGQSEIARAFLVTEGRGIVRFKDDYAESKGWSDAYLLTRDIGYVFCPPEISTYVFVATQVVLRSRFSIRIPPSMLAYAKQAESVLDEIRLRLADKGYYSKRSFDVRPLPQRMRKADVLARVRAVVERLSGYEGLSENPNESGKARLCDGRVIDWLRQFETTEHIEAALTALESVRMFSRNDVVQALRQFVSSGDNLKDAWVCPFGAPKDSSSIVTYYVQDVAKELGLRVDSLVNALNDTRTRPIIFVDDFIGSGHQGISIVETLLGAEASVDLREERIGELTEPSREALKGRRIGFLFVAGEKAGADRLRARAVELGLDATVYVATDDTQLPRLKSSLKPTAAAGFVGECSELGRQLLLDPERGHDDAWCAERSLGYGNQGFLVLFPYNTPSQTLTCLWKSGRARGQPWLALFPRRKKT